MNLSLGHAAHHEVMDLEAGGMGKFRWWEGRGGGEPGTTAVWGKGMSHYSVGQRDEPSQYGATPPCQELSGGQHSGLLAVRANGAMPRPPCSGSLRRWYCSPPGGPSFTSLTAHLNGLPQSFHRSKSCCGMTKRHAGPAGSLGQSSWSTR